jgi:hypothetical protein
MPRGDNSSYADKQKRQAEHIEEGYEGGRHPANRQTIRYTARPEMIFLISGSTL